MNVHFPLNAADFNEIDATAEIAVDNAKTIVKVSGQSAAVALTLAINDQLPVGASLQIIVVQGATGRNVTLGTGFDAATPDLTGVANDRDGINCVYNGTAFEAIGAWSKIVDAA